MTRAKQKLKIFCFEKSFFFLKIETFLKIVLNCLLVISVECKSEVGNFEKICRKMTNYFEFHIVRFKLLFSGHSKTTKNSWPFFQNFSVKFRSKFTFLVFQIRMTHFFTLSCCELRIGLALKTHNFILKLKFCS